MARAGNNGFHHRTEINKRIYRLGLKPAEGQEDATGSTPVDLTKKSINPMGFTRYGNVNNDFLKRTFRKTININKRSIATEEINLKWIDTASKFGHSRFQTKEERRRYLGQLKISKAKKE